ncbi:MAG: hypothetical protein ABSG59_16015 [Verrucomicrobiota bacterium]|jgi:hypothetical protein
MITLGKTIPLTVLLWLLAPALHAQTYSIAWYKIAGGGGASTGTNGDGVYSVSGTVGQPDACGAMAGGNYSLTGGFWSLISIVQTAGAPTLAVMHSGSGVVLSWPSSAMSFTLQQNSNLATTNWTTSSYLISTNGAMESITISSPAGNLFFRLVQ